MKIELLEGVGGFPAGSVHRVIGTYPADKWYGEDSYHLIEGSVMVRPSKARVVEDSRGPEADTLELGKDFSVAWYRAENDGLKARVREMAMQHLARDMEYEAWHDEKKALAREIERLIGENVDLKNQLADIKHEQEMGRWLR